MDGSILEVVLIRHPISLSTEVSFFLFDPSVLFAGEYKNRNLPPNTITCASAFQK